MDTLYDWLPGDDDLRTLQDIKNTLPGYEAGAIHPLVRLFENPVSPIAFKGAISLERHDYVHIVLNRGLTPQDEAFVLGFTMGTSKNVSSLEVFVYEEITKYLYPREYKFDDDLLKVFELGLHYGKKCDVDHIYEFPFEEWKHCTLREIRQKLKLNMQELQEVYYEEQQQLPDSFVSKRLLTTMPTSTEHAAKKVANSNTNLHKMDTIMADDTGDIRTYTMYPRIEGLIVTLVMLISICSTAYFIYVRALDAVQAEIQGGLLRSAYAIVNTSIDPELHKTFTKAEDEKTEAYQKAIRPLERLLETDPEIRFTYTNVLRDGKAYFVMDGTPDGDWDKDGVPDQVGVMELYNDASDDLMTALKEQKVVVSREPYQDKWGWFVSAQVPFYDKNHNFVGVYVLSVDARKYFEHLEPIQRATIRAVILGVLLSVLGGITVWFLRRFSEQINNSRMRLVTDLKDVIGNTRSSSKKNIDIVSNITRSISTSVNRVKDLAQIQLAQSSDSRNTRELEVLMRSSDEVLQVLNDMVELLSLQNNLVVSTKDKVRLEHIVNDVIQMMSSHNSSRNIEVSLSESTVLSQVVMADAHSIQQLFKHIISNAVRHTDSSKVMLASNVLEELENTINVQFTIAIDTTANTNGEAASKILKAFLHDTSSGTDNQLNITDIGLAISKNLVTLMKGTITAESSENSVKIIITLLLDKSSPTETLNVA